MAPYSLPLEGTEGVPWQKVSSGVPRKPDDG